LLFYGALEIEKSTKIGSIIGIIAGIGGLIPFLVHKVIVRRKDKFNLYISNVVIYFNILVGIITVILSVRFLV